MRDRHASRQWPDRTQTLLLRAALLDGSAAVRAWEEWKVVADPEHLDPGSQRLIPQLFQNLRGEGVRDALLESFKPAHRKTWTRNRVLFHVLGDLVRRLAEAGIDTLLLKGAALIPLAYRDYGRRPVGDLDVLVRLEQAPAAMALLRRQGWTPRYEFPERLIGPRHADDFVDPERRKVDLHWSVLQECCGRPWNEDFWAARIPLAIDGVSTSALCPADQLLHVCVHGTRSGPLQPVGWVADAMMVLKASNGAIDWDRLLDQTARRRLVVPMRGALRVLYGALGAAIPVDVLERIEAMPTSRTERWEHQVKTAPRPLLGSLPVLWFDYARLAGDASLGRKLLGFPRYLQCTFRTKVLWGLPRDMLRLAAGRIGARVGTAAGSDRAP